MKPRSNAVHDGLVLMKEYNVKKLVVQPQVKQKLQNVSYSKAETPLEHEVDKNGANLPKITNRTSREGHHQSQGNDHTVEKSQDAVQDINSWATPQIRQVMKRYQNFNELSYS